MSDGTVSVDTSINDKGFNKGIKEMAKTTEKGLKKVQGQVDKASQIVEEMLAESAKEAMLSTAEQVTKASEAVEGGFVANLKRMGTLMVEFFGPAGPIILGLGAVALAALVVVGIIVKITVVIIKTAVKIAKAFVGAVRTMAGVVSKYNEVGKQLAGLSQAFDNVKGSMYSLAATILPLLIPIVMKIVDWLVKWLNILAQVIALMSGQTTYKKYVMGSYKSDVQAIEKAAKGALSAFDDINVLTQEPPGQGAFGTPTGMSFEVVEIDKKLQELKEELPSLWERLSPKGFLEWLKVKWGLFVEWLKMRWGVAVTRIRRFFAILAEDWKIKMALLKEQWDIWVAGLKEKWAKFVEEWNEHIDMIKEGWRLFVERLKEKWAEWVEGIKEKIAELKEKWNTWIEGLKEKWEEWVEGLKEKWNEAMQIISDAWDRFKEGFVKAKNAIKTGFINMANSVIGSIESMINSALQGIQDLIDNINEIPGINIPDVGRVSLPRISRGVTPVVHPHLATGAVIPPNSQFAAILGDQTRGRNLEAPEDLIRQIVREEGGQGSQEVIIRFEGSMAQFIRQLKPVIAKEDTRIGKSLLSGGTV
jgi:hypothetical protein